MSDSERSSDASKGCSTIRSSPYARFVASILYSMKGPSRRSSLGSTTSFCTTVAGTAPTTMVPITSTPTPLSGNREFGFLTFRNRKTAVARKTITITQ